MPNFFTDPIAQPGQPAPHKPPIPDASKTQPAGVVPKRAQVYVIGGLAGLLLFVLFFAGGTQPGKRKPTGSPPVASTLTPERIKQFENELNDEVARQRQQAQQLGLANRPATPAFSPATPGAPAASEADAQRLAAQRSAVYPPSYPGDGAGANSTPRRAQAGTGQAGKHRDSLFASNVALTYRTAGHAATLPHTTESSGEEGEAAPEDRGDRPQALQSFAAREDDPASSGGHSSAGQRDAGNPNRQDLYHLFEGTIIETVLTNRLDGGFAGPVNCMVTTDVYSSDNQQLLIPQGSRVLGEVKPVTQFGQQRLAVVFHRLILPDVYSVSLAQFHGLSPPGANGLRDKVNNHYLQIFGVSLALGAIGGLTQIGNNYNGYGYDSMTQYRVGVTESLSESAYRILDRFLNVLPTFTIREGSRVKIYLSNDLPLPAYSDHSGQANP